MEIMPWPPHSLQADSAITGLAWVSHCLPPPSSSGTQTEWVAKVCLPVLRGQLTPLCTVPGTWDLELPLEKTLPL